MTGKIARLITVQVEPESSADGRHVFVSSKDVPGLYMMGASFSSMQDRIAAAITELFLHNEQLQVTVFWTTKDKSFAPKPEEKPVTSKSKYQLAVVQKAA